MTTENLEKAKAILNKSFCFMQWQEHDAIKAGKEVMGVEDIRYLREFKVESPHFNLLTITPEKGERISKNFLEEKINEAKIKKLIGIQISDREIYGDTMDVIKENNLFVSHNQMIATFLITYTYFFFDEENQIIHEIIKFQDFFGALATVVEANLI